MRCLITSFRCSHNLEAVWSAAVYQPKGYHYPKAEWADIRDENGKWTRPRDFIGEEDPLLAYRQALLNLYASRTNVVAQWLAQVSTFWGEFALCCWCPYDRAAQRQLQEHGSFVCHTAVIGEHLEQHHGVQVFYDNDRRLMKVLP